MDILKDFLGEPQYKKLMQTLEYYVEGAQKMGLMDIKPWAEFFTKFKAPKHWHKEEIEKRIGTNLKMFKANYLVLCTTIVLFMLVTSPLLLFMLFLCGGLWFYVLVMKPGPLRVGNSIVDHNKKMTGCSVLTVLLLVFSGQLLKLLGTIFLAAILTVGHMVFRRHSKSKSNPSSGNASTILGGIFDTSKSARKKKEKAEEDMEGGIGSSNDENMSADPNTGSSSGVNFGGHHMTSPHQRVGSGSMNY